MAGLRLFGGRLSGRRGAEDEAPEFVPIWSDLFEAESLAMSLVLRLQSLRAQLGPHNFSVGLAHDASWKATECTALLQQLRQRLEQYRVPAPVRPGPGEEEVAPIR